MMQKNDRTEKRNKESPIIIFGDFNITFSLTKRTTSQ